MQDRGRRSVQIKADAADKAGKFIAFGRMTNQSRRFVDDQQAGVFVEDGEQVFQARGDFNHETHEAHEILTTDGHPSSVLQYGTTEDGRMDLDFLKAKDGRKSLRAGRKIG